MRVSHHPLHHESVCDAMPLKPYRRDAASAASHEVLYKCSPGPGLLLRIPPRLQSTRREQLGETVGHHVSHFEYLRYGLSI